MYSSQGHPSTSYDYSGSMNGSTSSSSKRTHKSSRNKPKRRKGTKQEPEEELGTNSQPISITTSTTNMSSVSTSSNNRRSSAAVYTCQTCVPHNIFTCLTYYQEHRQKHAEENGTKLLICQHCPYSTDNQFHFNWHIMTHTGEEKHLCSHCMPVDDSDPSGTNNYDNANNSTSDDAMSSNLQTSSSNHHDHLKSIDTSSLDEDTYLTGDLMQDEEDEAAEDGTEEEADDDDDEDDLLNGSRRSVGTMATDTDDLLVMSNCTSTDDADKLILDGGVTGLEGYSVDDPTTLTFLDHANAGYIDEDEKKFHELGTSDHYQTLVALEDENGMLNYNGHHHMNHQLNHHDHNDITDEEDDEEEEIESEEDDDVDDFVKSDHQQNNHHLNNNNNHHYNGSQLGNSTEMSLVSMVEGVEQENSATASNNHVIQQQVTMVQQGPPYLKSPDAIPGTDPILGPNGIIPQITGRGRGKGNRKSRCISTGESGEEGEIRRKFHCSHCGKSFKTKSHLQRHILTHTGEKPYHCNRCGAKFNQSSSLRNHIIAIHTKEYPHFCPHCNKGFLMPALLTKHLSTNHRNLKNVNNADGVSGGSDGGGDGSCGTEEGAIDGDENGEEEEEKKKD